MIIYDLFVCELRIFHVIKSNFLRYNYSLKSDCIEETLHAEYSSGHFFNLCRAFGADRALWPDVSGASQTTLQKGLYLSSLRSFRKDEAVWA